MNNWLAGIDYPEWMEDEGLKTLHRQHLLEGETPAMMYSRVIDTLSDRLFIMLKATKMHRSEIKIRVKEIKQKWHTYIWNGWLSPATPILSNVGTKRGYGISCFILKLDDSLDSIYMKMHEMAMLTQKGGGVGVTFDDVRGRGESISTGGFSEGIIPFIKNYDSSIMSTSQGYTRRGAISINLNVRHKDIKEFLHIRLPEGDVNRQCLNINHSVSVDDQFMESLQTGNKESQKMWSDILSLRMKTGQPYIFYTDTVSNKRPEDMKRNKLKILNTNICTEIMLPHDSKHTVVCDLASLNMTKYNEWKNDPEFIELSLLFLDVNAEEFISNATDAIGFENAVRFCKKARALGLGLLGWASYLQMQSIPFTSLQARGIINNLGIFLKTSGKNYQEKWSKLLGSPEWCDKNRNLTLFAIAPTTTTSLIMSGVSQGIEPIIANAWIQKSAKGTFIRKNRVFKELVQDKYTEWDTTEMWNELTTKWKGSVQSFPWLLSEDKELFLTAYEINQLELVRQVALFQNYVDQGISTNLFFPSDVDPKWLNKVHLAAWQEGLKSLYYVRTDSISSKNMPSSVFKDCVFCEG
jgi:ribonucleoside-diphosphate reductase alpha chain